ncbi:transcriptional regulator, CarD family [Syntrophobotulus glycolicus DSM 8271]|uniref:Transcriptional regulator, CarD family n=1 Tax=Syntrophobotulus glycolicus (strain DSM 8271 / FlGlyR) TaxID=645991 RepID=F0T276_SYNGF|nr:CarD family transcriptional regulator [Syntrophobotulus glycolicus]ADY57504.1 transcriptional regulator, CarD family [Syntrophobotulus glycolicus DSM 8271]
MFQVGDKILYPMHGICIIDAVEKKELFGQQELCYILNIQKANMKITIPVDKATKIGVRKVVGPEILENILNSFNLGDTDSNIFENQRYCKEINKKKFKTGNINQGTEIIRDLTRKSRRTKLGQDDTNMLDNARRVFVSELMEVKGLALEQAVYLLDEALNSK